MMNKINKMRAGVVPCALCGKKLNNNDTKFVLASSNFNVNSMPLDKRVLCVDCYIKAINKTKSNSYLNSSVKARSHMRHRLAKTMLYDFNK